MTVAPGPPPEARPEPRPRRVRIGGVEFDAVTEDRAVAYVMERARRGEGGHILTPNVDILRAITRDRPPHDGAEARPGGRPGDGAGARPGGTPLRELAGRAELVVADGMPLVWASRLLGDPLPERVTGASLIWSLSAAAAEHGLPVYLLGGAPGVPERAARNLAARCPGLVVAGADAPPYGFDADPVEREAVCARVVAARPGIVFAGLGFPRQDLLIDGLRERLPGTWFAGCGAAIAFAAGERRRAPRWMRDAGLEWAGRLLAEPRRLAGRYLVRDLPFAVSLLARAALARLTSREPYGGAPAARRTAESPGTRP
ncbi:WecB/TagA/CpsF family glycosyltransferase [Bailinhaonella thermotolerans]|uniref:Glycosyltransferase n=1 Tax=Bailinhaonella thermotolerans TaxID=1070861 RepID=A0A3A4BQ63_9ACTN|nr:WecB/TagA/CpsF family glycosyltransferase [Bailinhaonella thermotolerans]RJL33286.1 glycosyltransferase [Bailinhaonella thermotolerans]